MLKKKKRGLGLGLGLAFGIAFGLLRLELGLVLELG